jgi:hypothetical protein
MDTNAPGLPYPDLFELEARFQAVLNQRNNALNEVAFLAGQLALAQREIENLRPGVEPSSTSPDAPAA